MWTTTQGTKLEYNTVLILTFVEEDGVLKVLEIKDFADPQKRGAVHTEVAKVLAKGVAVA